MNWLCIPSRLPKLATGQGGKVAANTLLEDVFPTVYSVLYCEDCFLDYTTGVVGHQPPRSCTTRRTSSLSKECARTCLLSCQPTSWPARAATCGARPWAGDDIVTACAVSIRERHMREKG